MEIIDTINEIDTNPYVLTTYHVNDYVLQCYPPTKIGSYKYGSWWRDPYQVTQVSNRTGEDLVDKICCTMVTDKEYVVDVTHIPPFYFDFLTT